MRERGRRRAKTCRLVAGVVGAFGLLWPGPAAAQVRPVSLPLLSSRVEPEAFGVVDDTITTISAWSFSIGVTSPLVGYDEVHVSPSLSRYNGLLTGLDTRFYATLNLPAGAVIDYVGVNTASDTDAVMGFALWQRSSDGSLAILNGFSLPAHGWDTDFVGPLGIVIDNHHSEYLLEVENAISPTHEYFGWVEVWWHRSVSPAPASPTFGDVPTTDPGFQYIEALAASGVTGGCGGGNYCPDASLTRRQMAIFLAKGLGLHWPY